MEQQETCVDNTDNSDNTNKILLSYTEYLKKQLSILTIQKVPFYTFS